MGFARNFDDLRNKMNQGDVLELSRVMRQAGKNSVVYSGFKVPQEYGKILILKVRFGNRPMDHANYNYNPNDNSILVIGDYSTISLIYRKPIK